MGFLTSLALCSSASSEGHEAFWDDDVKGGDDTWSASVVENEPSDLYIGVNLMFGNDF